MNEQKQVVSRNEFSKNLLNALDEAIKMTTGELPRHKSLRSSGEFLAEMKRWSEETDDEDD